MTIKRKPTSVVITFVMVVWMAGLSGFFPGVDSIPRPSRVIGAPIAKAEYEPGVVIVELKPNRHPLGIAARHNLTVLEQVEEDFWRLGINDQRTVLQVIDLLEHDRDVRSAEPNYLFRVPETNPRAVIYLGGHGEIADYYQQIALQLIRAAEAHRYADGHGVVVAVIDTGVDANHPSLGNVVGGYDFVDNDGDPSEKPGGLSYGHGTMVAGLIHFVAPNVRILPIRAFSPDGTGTTVDVSKAIRYAVMSGADIINMSFGTVAQPQAIRGAVNLALNRSILAASAGNDGTDWPVQYPASEREVVAVAALDSSDLKAWFSNFGSFVRLNAPGVSLISTYPGGGYAAGDGTSFSTALVSGTLALVRSAGVRDAAQVVEDSAINIDSRNPAYTGSLGRGRIDAYAAVEKAVGR